MAHSTQKQDKLEGLLWLLFSAGGMLVAFIIPVHIALNSLAPALGLGPRMISYDAMVSLLSNPIFKLYFIIVIAAATYHGMHRVRFVLYDLGLKNQHVPLMVVEHIIDAIIIISAIYYILLA